jgi:hypothetical protein
MNNETENKPIDISRRRLTKSGLAAPIVLATLASKNALAAPAYHCTISGKLSGGSTHSTIDSCDLGPTVADLKGGAGWGSVNKTAEFRSVFTDVYWKDSDGNLRNKPLSPPISGPGVFPVAATFNDVITIDGTDSGNPPHDVELGRLAIAVYVGWVDKGADYPLTLDQIKNMFSSAFNQTSYSYPDSINPKTTLTRDQVVSYFKFLTGETTAW